MISRFVGSVEGQGGRSPSGVVLERECLRFSLEALLRLFCRLVGVGGGEGAVVWGVVGGKKRDVLLSVVVGVVGFLRVSLVSS